MEQSEKALFETKHPPYIENIKRTITIWIILTIVIVAFSAAPLTVVLEMLILLLMLDFFTFFLPGISKKYIITQESLIRKSWFGTKTAYFEQIGSVTAAKGRILVVSKEGRVIFKIYEIYFHPAVREKFKNILFSMIED